MSERKVDVTDSNGGTRYDLQDRETDVFEELGFDGGFGLEHFRNPGPYVPAGGYLIGAASPNGDLFGEWFEDRSEAENIVDYLMLRSFTEVEIIPL